jgi:Protein of unknown function (DUF2934)
MSEPTEKQILNRAYEIWEQNGRPEGREDEFFNRAKSELKKESATPEISSDNL